MSLVLKKGNEIFSDGKSVNSEVYRGILALMSRFGYVSIREVMYGFDLPLQGAIDRLRYLERINVIERFKSFTVPEFFFCLTIQGREAASAHFVIDEIHEFRPADYSFIYQLHHRYLIKVFICLKKVLGADFKGWVTEATLRQEAGKATKDTTSNGQRVLDGEFSMTVHKTKFRSNLDGMEKIATTDDLWRCGVELELSLKSPERYRKQFKALAQQVYGWLDHVQRIPMIVFLYSTPTVFDRLVRYRDEYEKEFGRCLFIFGQVDQFLADLGNTTFVRFLGKERREMAARDLNQIQTKVAQ